MTKCIGCGITLQDKNKDAVGYTPDIKNKLCERCFKLKNYNILTNKGVSIDNDALIEKINLTNVTVLQKRAEDIGRDPMHREQYDIAVSRAVANLSPLCEYCLPLVKVNGDFIAYKSNKAEEEIATSRRAITTLGGKIAGTETFLMNNPSDNEKIERTLIDIKKVKKIPATYPRKAGTPTKKPL